MRGAVTAVLSNGWPLLQPFNTLTSYHRHTIAMGSDDATSAASHAYAGSFSYDNNVHCNATAMSRVLVTHDMAFVMCLTVDTGCLAVLPSESEICRFTLELRGHDCVCHLMPNDNTFNSRSKEVAPVQCSPSHCIVTTTPDLLLKVSPPALDKGSQSKSMYKMFAQPCYSFQQRWQPPGWDRALAWAHHS